MQRYKDWVDKWNNAPEAELQSVMDDLDAVIVAFIGDCEAEGIETSELRFLLAKFRRFNSWNIREEIAQRFEWIAKRIVGERYREALRQEAQQAASESQVVDTPIVETPHPYKVYYARYCQENPRVQNAEAAAAKAYWNSVIDKAEKRKLSEGKTKEEAEVSFRRRFKYYLDK